MYDVVIIGAGPAGYTAALYTSRAFLKTLLITGIQEGGQLTTTTEVENFPGFPKGIKGPQLMLDMKAQVLRFGIQIESYQVSSIKYQEKTKTFILDADGKTFEGKSVIIATGASAQYLGLPSEKKLAGRGVSACATCDGFFFRGKEVVVVGGGDTAMEEANFLTTFATRVTIIHRRAEFRASPIMLERAKKNPKITFLVNKQILEVVGDSAVTGVKIKDNETGKEEVYPAQGVFLAIGHKPNTEFLKGFIDLDQKGYVMVHGMMKPGDFHTATNVPGVFAAGDCVDFQYRQAVVAAGMGCMAALDAQKYVAS
ncbi:thioredoxin-disulfide reductase [Candidatus Gottesmanbacteria bacterium RIFOXYB1_FULL_47_11]|uniref:Thioredoxin reductase n=1 Tax=Candidatus Gottesmanbacteria bacterium RIFOXYB1_FULL_47_11 TaxID=1798401 RepID=A0A1F6BEN1_9BACT|nr:MAG: thioredoxin-disulfide reductase [Candidatus Gottesmanbacteria bacterium RIFOXYB1_FULL_47_11]